MAKLRALPRGKQSHLGYPMIQFGSFRRVLSVVFAQVALGVMYIAAAGAQSPDCGWQHHFEQLNGNPAQNCLKNFEPRYFVRSQISTVQTSRIQALADLVMPAVCMSPIPCNWQNASASPSVEHYTEFSVSVSGSMGYKGKISLGIDLLKMLEAGAEIQTEWSLGLGISFTTRTTYTHSFTVYQQDCHKVTWKFWKTRNSVTGTSTEVEEYHWVLHEVWYEVVNGVVVVHPCPTPDDPVVTTCDGDTASGQAHKEVAIELEQIITRCCSPLPPDENGPPWCCARECPQ